MESTVKKSLSGKTVVVTGGSSGVGRAVAENFASKGANVVVVARGMQGINETVKYCVDLGGNAVGIAADMSINSDVERVAQTALKINGKIDIWVNNAGVMASGKFEEIPMEIHEQVVKTNLMGYLHGAYHAIKIFKMQNQGMLINNVSIGGYMPAPYSAVYSATKFGIRGMMECIQGEISHRKHIHVCNVYPQMQNSTGNLHSAKYSGFDMNIPPIASDPRGTASKIVALATHPKKHSFPDFRAGAITNLYRLAPTLIINLASAAVRYKMQRNEIGSDDAGNVLEKSKEPFRVYGNPPASSGNKKLGFALLAGAGLGLFFLAKRECSNR